MNAIPLFSSGGIGDLIISLSWIESIIKPLGIPVHFYSNFPEIASYFMPWLSLSKDLRSGETAKVNFDYFISISDIIFFERRNENELPFYIKPIYEAVLPNKKEWEEYLMRHPLKGNEMAHKAISLGLTRWTLPFHFVGRQYSPFVILDKVEKINVPDRFITIHDGFDATGHYKFIRSTKSWSIPFWEEFVDLFKIKYPDIHVIQLGGLKHQKIRNVDINYAGQLSFEKSLEYLNSSILHIDGDSGLVHARRMLNKPSVVMFGPTNINYFGYPENINLAPKVCGDCWWKDREWMAKCMKGYDSPKCMDSIKPEDVIEAVGKIIID